MVDATVIVLLLCMLQYTDNTAIQLLLYQLEYMDNTANRWCGFASP